MKAKNIVLSIALLTAGNASAACVVFESYGIIKVNASTNTYYDMQASTANPDFQGASLGTFDTGVGNTLTLVGGEIKTWKNGASNVTGGNFDYRVYTVGSTPGSFSGFSMGWRQDISSSDQKWDNTTANANLLTGLASGNYTLEVFAYALTNEGNQYSNNGGNNFKASFTVIPEPASAMLGLLGSVALLRRKR